MLLHFLSGLVVYLFFKILNFKFKKRAAIHTHTCSWKNGPKLLEGIFKRVLNW
jgi:hypothetical protein